MAEQPQVVVLGGANGAGKTTASRTLLADTLKVMAFVNADVIAQGLSGFDPDSAAIEASRVMLERLRGLAANHESFAFETTLAGRSYVAFLRELRTNGHSSRLFYFWVDDPEINVQRVALRVLAGGHNIPEATIRQRYDRSIRNFLRLYRGIVDNWHVYDTTDANRISLIAESDGLGERVIDPKRWSEFTASVNDE